MRSRDLVIFLTVISLFPAESTVEAQNTRSAVSVMGSDAATCTVPDPCRTFGAAISRTNGGGEILAITSGGYGPFTIDRDVTVHTAPGVYAGINAAAAGTGIFVNAGATAKVVIRGLNINGLGTGNIGIQVTGGAQETHIEHCIIERFSAQGISASLNTRISDTTIRQCGAGIKFDNPAVAVQGTIDRVEIRKSANAGIFSGQNSIVTVRDSVVVVAQTAYAAETGGQLMIENCLAADSTNGITAGSGGATVRISNTMATNNGTGLSAAAGSTVISWGNNKIQGNTTDKVGTITVVTQN